MFFLYVQISFSARCELIAEEIHFFYAPSIDLDGDECSCHFYTFLYDVYTDELLSCDDVFFFKDNDFLGLALIFGLREEIASAHVVETTVFAEFSRDCMAYIIENMMDSEVTNEPSGYYGSLMYYRKSNDYEFESTIALFHGREEYSDIEREKHQLSEFATVAGELDSNWVLEI